MSARTKGPRLYWRKARPVQRIPEGWVIRDGSKEIRTGCGESQLEEAQRQLATYIEDKWRPEAQPRSAGPRNPAEVYITEVIALYATEKAPAAADPGGVRARLDALLDWWQELTVADVIRSNCKAYVAHRITQPIKAFTRSKSPKLVSTQGARRELEDLSSAIGYWDAEHPLLRRPSVWLPDKPESRRDALTRAQAARLLMAARGYRWTGQTHGKLWEHLGGSVAANRRHLRRFALMGFYTGTRPGVLPKLQWHESPDQAWADLDKGMIWRRGKDEVEHKTKRRPVVRLPQNLLGHMRRWKAFDERLAEAQDAGEHAATKRRAKPLQRPTTVLHHGGRPIGKVRTGWEGMVRDAGLEGEITPHWMRHTCVTWLMEADVPIWDVAAFTGMSPTMIEKNYGHHRPSHQSKARSALGGKARRKA